MEESKEVRKYFNPVKLAAGVAHDMTMLKPAVFMILLRCDQDKRPHTSTPHASAVALTVLFFCSIDTGTCLLPS